MAASEQPVLILGAGINGAALARELLLNGLPVCVVDTADIASGASAYSSRLIHGGLRYLEYGDFDLVRESLAERTRLLRLAPQYVHPLRLYIPVTRRSGGIWQSAARFVGLPVGKSVRRGRWLVSLGLNFYDAYAKDPTLPRHATHTLTEPGVPPINPDQYRWACSYWDAQVPATERYVLALLEDARRIAAERRLWFRVYTYHQAELHHRQVEVTPIAPPPLAAENFGGGKSPDEAAELSPSEPVEAIRFTPAAVINATGAWVDRTLSRLDVAAPRLIGGTKGSHLLTTNARLRELLGGNAVYAEADDGRPMFILPVGEAVLIGTTDLPFEGNPADATATDEEIDYLLGTVNHVFPQAKLTRDDIDMHYAGVRPLPYSAGKRPGAVSRRHAIKRHEEVDLPFYSIIGGKLTTSRSLAEEGTAILLRQLRIPVTANSQDRTLPGGENYPPDAAVLKAEQQTLAAETGFPFRAVAACWPLLGTRVGEVLRNAPLAAGDGPELPQLLAGTSLPIAAVRWIIAHEWVTTLPDLIERRLLLHFHPGISPRTLEQLATLLVQAGKLSPSARAPAIEHATRHLRVHYGKRLTGGS